MSENFDPMSASFDHFVDAQNPVFEAVLDELRAGRKQSHWMWFVFPQIAGLGTSETAQRFAIGSLQAAQDYLAHPVLGARLKACTREVLGHAGQKEIRAIFGAPDDRKFHSSMTLFHRAAPQDGMFADALTAFFNGNENTVTLERLGQ